jgi:thiamine transport system substrate-binding protein
MNTSQPPRWAGATRAGRRGGPWVALAGLAAVGLLAGCEPERAAPAPAASAEAEQATALPGAGQTLRLMTHDSFAVSDEVLAEFEAQTGAKVQVLESGDAGSALNKAILAGDTPLADVFYGVDNTFLGRALDEGIFEPYTPAALARIPEAFQVDPTHHALPVDYGDVCLNVDRRWFEAHDLAPPAALDDLLEPAYRGLTVVESPVTSSPGLAFLLVTIAGYGEAGYLDYWRDLLANDTLVVNDWETAYNAEFSGGPGQGTRPIVVSYASSPAFEVLYGENVTEPGSAAITADGSCFRQIELVGILAGTPRRALAERWVDFMLAERFQADLPGQMFVFPVLPGVPVDPVFTRFLATPANPVALSPAEIAAGRERWLKAWTEAVQ